MSVSWHARQAKGDENAEKFVRKTCLSGHFKKAENL